MNFGKIKTAYQFSWKEVSKIISMKVSAILNRTVDCKASPDSSDYWGVVLHHTRISMDELDRIFSAVDASVEVQKGSLGEDNNTSIASFGMELGELLIREVFEWETYLIEEKGLTFISTTHKNTKENKHLIKFHNFCVDTSTLKTKKQLLNYLLENEPTHSALMDFCAEYREKYHNELCWHYPISDGKHLGTFLVLVREGVLSLPYDAANETDYEIFQLQDVAMFDANSMQIFIDDWNSFDQDLMQAMYSMKNYLHKQEK